MTSLRTAPRLARALAGALLALLLALRLLSPAGFMPQFGHGGVTIVACTDEGGTPAPPMHHQGPKQAHAQCPYAAAAGLGALLPELPPLAAMAVLAVILLLRSSYRFLERSRADHWPPTRGPPVPA